MAHADDVKMLSELLRWADEHPEAEHRFNVAAFEDMLRRISVSGRELNPKQRSWVQDVHEKIIGTPHYENLVSSGRVPTGKPVDTPPMLRKENLPKRPPMRRREED